VGYETLLIAYREDDPLRFVADRAGRVVPAGRCGICRRNVFVNESGAKSMRERDCAVVCRHCRHDPDVGYHPTIMEAL
jgi:hypothetical protein